MPVTIGDWIFNLSTAKKPCYIFLSLETFISKKLSQRHRVAKSCFREPKLGSFHVDVTTGEDIVVRLGLLKFALT